MDTSLDDWLNAGGAAERAAALRARLASLRAAERAAAIAFLPPEDTWEAAFAAGLAQGGPLAGVPYFAKDIYDKAGWPTAASTRFLTEERPVPHTDAALVRDFGACGAVCAGKTHLHEFAYGFSGVNPHFGTVPHPRFPDRVAGGSSSGSAWAVGKGLVPFALGTDTGGSIRIPAAFCGLHGVRLTRGDWAREGCFPLAPSFDTAGWFAASGADMARLLRIMVGGRESAPPKRVFALTKPLTQEETDPAFHTAHVDAARALGAAPLPADATREFLRLAGEAPAHFAVLQSTEVLRVHAAWIDPRKPLYDPAVWQRIARARDWTPRQIDAAEAFRPRMDAFFAALWREADAFILPAAPFPAHRADDDDEAARGAILRHTAPASLSRLPALTVPVPLPGGLSGGLQILVPHDAENRLTALCGA